MPSSRATPPPDEVGHYCSDLLDVVVVPGGRSDEGIGKRPHRVVSMSRILIALLLVFSMAACSNTEGGEAAEVATASESPSVSSSTSPTASQPAESEPSEQALRDAVTAYSDAFLDGEVTTAYKILSSQCRSQNSLAYFTGIVTAFSDTYGKALPIKTFEASISGDTATVSYTYDVPALDQIKEPWVLEGQQWKNDDC